MNRSVSNLLKHHNDHELNLLIAEEECVSRSLVKDEDDETDTTNGEKVDFDDAEDSDTDHVDKEKTAAKAVEPSRNKEKNIQAVKELIDEVKAKYPMADPRPKPASKNVERNKARLQVEGPVVRRESQRQKDNLKR
jgi:hypothetical protein